MVTLDDRLLGEKLHYYCSSSEDEEESEESCSGTSKGNDAKCAPPPAESQNWEGSSTNTGPKGVLKDWQRFKQLETENRREQEREKINLAKRLALSCRSHLDDEKEKQEREREEEDDVDKLIDDQFLRQYISKRMEEMMTNTSMKSKFGRLISLEDGNSFLDAVDKEDKAVTVIIHIYDLGATGCEAMNGCLTCLAQDYPHVKFCKLPATAAGVSKRFKVTGLPALLVYKEGQLMGNFVRLTDEFGEDFYATDVESFLIEHGMLRDRSLIPPGIRDSSIAAAEDGDSDFSLDD